MAETAAGPHNLIILFGSKRQDGRERHFVKPGKEPPMPSVSKAQNAAMRRLRKRGLVSDKAVKKLRGLPNES